MTSQFYGQIDLTQIEALDRIHPGLIRRVKFHDGEHLLLTVTIQQLPVMPDKFGNTHAIVAYCQKKDRKDGGGNYYIGKLQPSKF